VPTNPRFELLLPPPRVRESASSKGTLRSLRVAFWSSLFGTALAVVWMIQCGLEARRAPERLDEAESAGARREAAARKKLAEAENELTQQRTKADDLRNNAIKSDSTNRDLRGSIAAGDREVEQWQPQIAAAEQKVKTAKQAFDDCLIEVERLTRDAWLERKQSQRLLFWSITAVAVGAVVTFATGWVWRRAG
jgi:hypothetical protein